MKTKLLIAASVGACALAWAAKDPVIMVVNGVDVPKSEFEYLYHKNSQQQLAPQPLEDYVEMFVNYRLKVADAMADGIDTTATFRQEMEQYRHDLAAPYMVDSTYLNKLVDEAYRRARREVLTSHIMRFKRQSTAENLEQRAILDSLSKVLANGGDFAELANEYSEDRGSNNRGGSLGYVVAGRFPYAFEKAAFDLKPGEVSGIVESPVGYHLVKAVDSRPARGTVRASHILIFDKPEYTEAERAAAAARMDSIYDILKVSPGKFEALAIQFSDDKGSARQGGLLPWFGTGQMVPEFEEAAFSMAKGEISKPFRTQYGWHIIYKLDEKGVPEKDVVKPEILNRMNNPQDGRYELIRRNQNKQLSKKHKATLNQKTYASMHARVINTGLDSVFYDVYSVAPLANEELLKVGNKVYTAGDFTSTLRNAIQPDRGMAADYLEKNLEGYTNRKLLAAEEDWLEANNADYRNLYHEYCNGSLLYEASVKNVWDVAAKDTEGLTKYFNDHRAEYAWKEPRAKGILVQAKNDSVQNAIISRYAELGGGADAIPTLRKEFKGEAAFERVLAQKGTNAMVDNLLFDADPTKPSNSNYTVYFMLEGRVLEAPEDYTDVKGQVTGDYQEALEEEWLKKLHAKYPVTINRKVLKKVK